MSSSVSTALIAAGVAILTTLVTVLYGPVWKTRLARDRDREELAERLIARYSQPLAWAAYDLQSQIYNIMRQGLLDRPDPTSYNESSTVWLFGQYLAWVEILRREVQLLDLRDDRRTARLQLCLRDISAVMASSREISDPVLLVHRAEQRAIGELMVVQSDVDGALRRDCMGYAQFCRRLADPAFASWFAGLGASVRELTTGIAGHTRPMHLQRALIDLIDLLDPTGIRFPDFNERGKIPLPAGVDAVEGQKRARPAGQLARFRHPEDDVWQIFESWAAANGLTAVHASSTQCRARLSRWRIVWMTRDGPWVELGLTLGPARAADLWGGRLDRQARTVLQDLLRRFDRPVTHLDRVWGAAHR